MGAQVESSSSSVRNFFFNEPAQICATCLFIQTHELFFLRQVKLLSIDWVFFFSFPSVRNLIPPASQVQRFYEWKIEPGECCKAARDLWWEPSVYRKACEIGKPVFLLILASPSMNNLLRQLAFLAPSLRDRYTRDLAVHFSLRRRTRSRCYQHRRCCAGHWFMHTVYISPSLGMKKCYQSSGRLCETWNRRIERSPIKIAKCRCRGKVKTADQFH